MLIPRASSLIFRRQYSHVFFLFGAVIILNGCINSGLADSDECANKSQNASNRADCIEQCAHCLLPKHFDRKNPVSLYDSSDRSLWLHLALPKRYENCTFERLLLKYKIMYTELVFENIICSTKTCNIIETYDRVTEITNLTPYTRYQFQISSSNYYTESMDIKTKFTRPIVFQTNPGAPSLPRNVSANILSPTKINLSWLPPEEINGPSIRYEVYYETENEIDGLKHQFYFPMKDDKVTSIKIVKLLPNQPYNIWIRAYSTETLYNQSFPIKVTTMSDLNIRSTSTYHIIAVAALVFLVVFTTIIMVFGCFNRFFLVVTTNDNPNVYDDPYESPNIYEEIDVNQEFPLPEVEYEYIYTTTL